MTEIYVDTGSKGTVEQRVIAAAKALPRKPALLGPVHRQSDAYDFVLQDTKGVVIFSGRVEHEVRFRVCLPTLETATVDTAPRVIFIHPENLRTYSERCYCTSTPGAIEHCVVEAAKQWFDDEYLESESYFFIVRSGMGEYICIGLLEYTIEFVVSIDKETP